MLQPCVIGRTPVGCASLLLFGSGSLRMAPRKLGLGFWKPFLEIGNPRRINRMRAQKFRKVRGGATVLFVVGGKSLPKSDRFLWGIPGASHVNDPDVIGFGLLGAVIWQFNRHL